MSDLIRNVVSMIVPIEGDLRKRQKEIQINEKKSIIDALKIKLRDLKEIEERKLLLQISVLEKEIEFLKKPEIDIKTE